MQEKTASSSNRLLAILIAGVFLTLAIALLFAWVSSNFQDIQGLIYFLLTSLLCIGLLTSCWLGVKASEADKLPRSLLWLVILSIIIRLAAGIFWYTALPNLGHNSPAEQSGYVMADAYHRDKAAWDLAESDKPLWKAFRNQRAVDQYGGLLFISGFIYRYISGDVHYPLQITLVTATASGLGILFLWVVVRRLWNQKAAWISAWIMLLYPESILIGSSQMREGFTITLALIAFYGLIGYLQEHRWSYLLWLAAGLLLFLPFSPPFAALLAGMLLFTSFYLYSFNKGYSQKTWALIRSKRLWVILAGVSILILLGVWFSLDQFTPDKTNNPISMLNWWLSKSAGLQAYRTERSSGIIQAIFDRTPEWTQPYLLIAYGVAQPLLPAALITTSEASVWQGIAIWRSLGWTILLILVFYATLKAWSRDGDVFARILTLLVWAAILVASFRGGGDQWDNPRYRVTFLGFQVALATWAWLAQRRSRDPIFRYVLIWIILTVAWLIPWYLYRKFSFDWPVEDLFLSLTLAGISAIAYIIFDQVRRKRESKKISQ